MNDPNEIIKMERAPRRAWTHEEDEKIKTIIMEFMYKNRYKYGDYFIGPISWPDISKPMGTRTARQCKDRYLNYLSSSIPKPWTQQEDDMLNEKYNKFGGNWKVIVNYFKGRSLKDLKNHWMRIQDPRYPNGDKEYVL